jgi:hypothetical protein
MVKIQLLQLPQNSQNLLERKKESFQDNDSLRRMTTGVDLFVAQTNEQGVIVMSATFGNHLASL